MCNPIILLTFACVECYNKNRKINVGLALLAAYKFQQKYTKGVTYNIMKKKVVLFDLDGTLLPMDQDQFTKIYFMALVKKLGDMGLPASNEEEQRALGKAVWAGTYAMMKNDGEKTNEEVFFSTFAACTGVDLIDRKSEFNDFYHNEFHLVSKVFGKNPMIKSAIEEIKGRGYRVAIATNPLFPLIANEQRLSYAGFLLSDFEFCTCYENSRHCKPNLEYYRDIIEHLGVKAEECVMVGNDVGDDMVARKLGMDVFLITDCLINAQNDDIEQFPHGNWSDLLEFLE